MTAVIADQKMLGPTTLPRRLAGGWLSWTRRFAAWLGLASLLACALLGENLISNRFASLAFGALAIATLLGVVEATHPGLHGPAIAIRRRGSIQVSWRWAVLCVAAISAIASQNWFRPAMAIAAGDVPPPNGSAWLSRLFSAWAWSGSDLGSPSSLEQQLPWAGLVWAVHFLGGPAELPQRLWFVLFFSGAGFAALLLLRTLGAGPPAAAIGALAYLFSPFVVANVIPNPVMLTALALLPTLPAIVILGAQRQLDWRIAVVLIGATAPFLGFIFINPPTLGTVLVATVATPAIAWWVYGAPAGRRAMLILSFAIPLLILLSAYWIVPSLAQLPNAALVQLSAQSNWHWTEARATLLNDFWLNSNWAWAYPEYFPFARVYDDAPMSILKFAPAVVAFAALTLRHRDASATSGHLRLRLAVAASFISLIVIFVGTGTNPPGSAIFNRLYALPGGWLLREPGRFLLVADLMFGILIASTIERSLQFDRLPGRRLRSRRLALRLSVGLPIGVATIIAGLPLLTGAIVPDNRAPLPPMHVHLPNYWGDMASYVDSAPTTGAVFVLPADDYYQMPYQWGYYGSDGFITQLMKRPVLIPSKQSYFSTAPQLLRIEDLALNSILTEDWQLERRLLRTLGSSLVLVRGDVRVDVPGRSIVSPSVLTSALMRSDQFELIHVSGPLSLFQTRNPPTFASSAVPYFATTNTASPDLRVLSRLPDGAAIVTRGPLSGVPTVLEVPAVVNWKAGKDQLTMDVTEEQGRHYSLIRLNSRDPAEPLDGFTGTRRMDGLITVTRITTENGASRIRLGIGATETMENGDFRSGPWGPIGDCNHIGQGAIASLGGDVVESEGPGGGPFLRLSAYTDSACEAKALRWRSGPLMIALDARHVAGASPRICLWESGPERCAALPTLNVTGMSWTTYRSIVVPDPGTRSLTLFLYADGLGSGPRTQADYANVHAVEVSTVPELDLLGTPDFSTSQYRLNIHLSTYSETWRGPIGSDHVIVNGLLNGWIARGNGPFEAVYEPATMIHLAFATSVTTAILTGILAAGALWRRSRRHARTDD